MLFRPSLAGMSVTPPTPGDDAPEPQAGLLVLVVDDNRDAADSQAVLLGLWGHRPRVAYDADGAFQSVAERPPDVVLLDLGLPGKDGFALAAELRALDGMRDARFYALTGHTSYRKENEPSFDDILIKPVDPDTLRRLLADVHSLRQRRLS